MEALEAIRKRRSIRRYTGEPIPREDLETIVDAGRLAAIPSILIKNGEKLLFFRGVGFARQFQHVVNIPLGQKG